MESVRSHDFQTPRYLECSVGGFTFTGVGDDLDGFIIVGLKDRWDDILGRPCLSKSQIMGIVWVFSKFTEPPDPQSEFDYCWVLSDVFCSSFVGELDG